MNTITYNGMSIDAHHSIRLFEDKIFFNLKLQGKHRDLFYQELHRGAKSIETLFRVQMLNASIIATKIEILETKGALTDDVIRRLMPIVIQPASSLA